MKKKQLILGMTTVLLLTVLISYANATRVETVTVEPFDEEVLVFDLDKGDKFSGSLAISGGANDDIKFWITNPLGNIIVNQGRINQGTIFEFTAQEPGAYTLHFDNTFSWISEKTVSLSYDISKSASLNINTITIILILLIASLATAIVILVGVLLHRRKTQTISKTIQ